VIPLNTPAILSFTGDGTEQIIFPITFPTFESSNVQVEVVSPTGDKTDLVIDTHYTLSSIGIPNTNAKLNLVLSPSFPWTMPTGLTQDYILKIKFSTNAFQPAKLRDLGRFAPEIIEKVVDRLTMNVLALREFALEIQSQFQELSDKVDILEEDLSDLSNEVQDQQTQIDDVNLVLDTHELRLEALETSSLAIPQVVLKSADFSASFNSIYVVTNTVDDIEVLLPSPEANKIMEIKKLGSNLVTLVRSGSEKIDGVATNKSLTSAKESVTLTTDGVDWFII
jgi:hypothetical protein